MVACALVGACTNDGVENNVSNTFPANQAFINVRLSDVGSMGTRGTDGGYEYGSADEHAVKTAHFYFYDNAGLFVSEGSAWNGGNASDKNPAENIEFRSNTVVVLENLEGKGYPNYMVTVLNKPANFTAPQTLDEMEKLLVDGITTTADEKTYFTMSTSSYKRDDNTKYFVTPITEDNFTLEPVDVGNITNYVEVYVERLAAKVTLGVSSELTSKTIEGKDGVFYPITSTVAGDDNDETTIANENLLIQFRGWKLNGTANKSHIVKNINTAWTDEELGFAWNKAADFRSFWGKSFNYGVGTYTYGVNGDNCPLTYVNLNDNLVEVGKSTYCAENTNTADVLNTEGNNPAAITSILLKAVVCDAEGNALDLVRYNGVLFEDEQFLSYVLNVMNSNGNWNVWVAGENGTYTQLDETGVELVKNGSGVKVQLKAGQTLYTKVAEGQFETIADVTTINEKLGATCAGAIGYKGGEMFYNIPIEHLNPIEADATTLEEANYGIVRNHHYVINITKLDKVGKGIFTPEEEIVPDDTDKDTYAIGAKINILSWKVVNQNVEL